jgi:hypothetical protein
MDIFDHSTSTGCFSNKEYTDDTLGELRVHVNLKHRVNDARDFLSSYSNRRDQSGLKGCFTAMWKGNGKTTTVPLFLDSLFPKTEIPCICEMLLLETRNERILSIEGGSYWMTLRTGEDTVN